MSKMNLPNKLTLLRLCLVPVVMLFLLIPAAWISPRIIYAVAAVLFILASLTDMLDGKIARARGLITDFGKFMDPIADKYMVIGTLLVILFRMSFPHTYGVYYSRPLIALFFVLVMAIIFRELGITSMRMILAGKGIVLAADKIGKIKTVTQIFCICVMLLEPYLRLFCAYFLGDTFVWRYLAEPRILAWIGVVAALFFTVVSGAHYLWANRAHFLKDM